MKALLKSFALMCAWVSCVALMSGLFIYVGSRWGSRTVFLIAGIAVFLIGWAGLYGVLKSRESE